MALTIARRIGRAGKAFLGTDRAPAEPPRKILLIKMIEQGATVLAYRAIERAVEMVGRENVYFWVFENNRAIMDVLDLIPPENILAVRAGNLFTFVGDVLGHLLKVRRLGIDATVDMEFFARATAALAFLTGARAVSACTDFRPKAPTAAT